MRIAKNSVVAIDYTLKDDDGMVIDTSDGGEPLWYLHGTGGLIVGLERELTGKHVGDHLEVVVSPEDGYGEWSETLQHDVSKDEFEEVDNLELGMQFEVDSGDGPTLVTVVEISDDIVTLDGNHPLAGVTLSFDVTIRDVREATAEELAHGHVHGPGGHSH